jgi:transglutaminase-like putative cysteine protease
MQRRHLTLVAAGVAILASMPLATVFERWTWLMYAVTLVAALCGTAVIVRSLRVPVWVPTIAMVGVYAIVMTWLFPSGKEFAGVLPDLDTVRHFGSLLGTAGEEMRSYGVPVEDRPGFLFLSTLGVGGVAIVIDLVAAVLRRPALAGLPMLAIYSVPVAVHQDSVSIWPFVVGAAGFLWLLVSDNIDRVRRFGRRFTGDGRDIDAWEPSPLAAAGQRLGLIGIVLAVLLPLGVPGMTEGLLNRFGGDGTGTGVGTGSGAGVGLEAMLSGELHRDRTIPMVKVTTNDPNPYYLRFAIADQLGPNGFTARIAPQGRTVGQGIPETPMGPGGTAHDYQATVDVLNFDSKLLPVYLQPTKVNNLDNSWQWDPSQSVVFSTRSDAEKKKYTFEYRKVDYAPEVLQRAKPLPANNPIQQRFTQTPRVEDVDARVQALTAGKTTPYDRVRAVFDSFSPALGFSYDVSPEPGNSGSALVDFLNLKKGYCVQYAAALAWLVRAAGVPARVAFGFTRGNASTPNTATTLTNFNLHAWTEVYLDGFGWLPFDATPATNVLGSASPAYAPNPSRPSDAQSQQGDDTLTPTTPDPSSSAAAPAAPGQSRAESSGGTTVPVTRRWPIWTLLVVLGALALLATPAVRRAALRRRRLRFRTPPRGASAVAAVGGGSVHPDASAAPGSAAAPGPGLVVVADDASQLAARLHAHAAWDELLDTMTDFRFQVDDAETPRATAERLVSEARLAEQPAAGVRLLGRAEERARYSRTALPDGDLRSALITVRAAVAGRTSRRTRVLATILPPSVVQRWRLATVSGSSQLFNSLAGGIERVTRAVSVRRLLVGRTGR